MSAAGVASCTWRAPIVAFALLGMACGAPRDVAKAKEASDRAGIQAALVHVDTLPESDTLFVGRVQGALLDPAGTFVTDQAGRRAIFWPADGNRPTAIGRPGAGPGEFLGPINLGRAPDNVRAPDVAFVRAQQMPAPLPQG